MIVDTFVLGHLQTNTYLIKRDNKCLVVDPAYDFEFIKKQIGKLNLEGILITHYHFDHIGALDEVKKYYKVPIYDYKNIKNNSSFNFKIISNPGHTSDSVSFYFEEDKVMFVGDFLFKCSIGRTDLDTGNNFDMINSLKNIIKYNDDIIIYPGHGEKTTLGFEKENNIYLKRQK